MIKLTEEREITPYTWVTPTTVTAAEGILPPRCKHLDSTAGELSALRKLKVDVPSSQANS
jgi:hypothetical protein